MNPICRRSFLSRTLQAVATTGTAPYLLQKSAVAAESSPQAEKFCAFTESFQSWPIPKVCEKFREIGLDGLDLTVRPGGHIQPDQAAIRLPEAVKAAKDNGVSISMLTTAINDSDTNAEVILEKCGELGIDRVKLGYFPYKDFGTLLHAIDDARARIARVAALAQKYGVLPCVHIHSGPIIPASGPAAYLLLRDFQPGEVGAYVDPMHMTIEGGIDGWRQGLDLLAPWISISSVKNCVWVKTGRDNFGQERWEIKKCPVADGMAPIPDFMATLRKLGYRGLFSMHSEYQGGGSWKDLTADECLEQTRIDLKFVKSILNL